MQSIFFSITKIVKGIKKKKQKAKNFYFIFSLTFVLNNRNQL